MNDWVTSSSQMKDSWVVWAQRKLIMTHHWCGKDQEKSWSGGVGLIQDLKDFFKSYVYVNAKHTICEWRFVGGGLKPRVGLRQQWRSSLFPPYSRIRELIGLWEICSLSPLRSHLHPQSTWIGPVRDLSKSISFCARPLKLKCNLIEWQGLVKVGE